MCSNITMCSNCSSESETVLFVIPVVPLECTLAAVFIVRIVFVRVILNSSIITLMCNKRC